MIKTIYFMSILIGMAHAVINENKWALAIVVFAAIITAVVLSESKIGDDKADVFLGLTFIGFVANAAYGISSLVIEGVSNGV